MDYIIIGEDKDKATYILLSIWDQQFFANYQKQNQKNNRNKKTHKQTKGPIIQLHGNGQ